MSTHFTQELLDILRDGVVTWSFDWRCVRMNRAAEELLSCRQAEVVGRPLLAVFPDLEPTPIHQAAREAMTERRCSFVAANLWHGRWYESEVYPTAEGVTTLLRDVHVRRETELERDRVLAELRLEREARERVISILGHDLQNPLAAAALSVDRAMRTDLPVEARRALERVESSTARMQRLVSQLINLAQLRAGPLPLVLAPVDAACVLEQVVEETRAAFPEARIELTSDGVAEGQFDRDRLGQLFSNLLSNAIQHGVGQQVLVFARVAADAYFVSVTNAARSLPAHVRGGRFDPFGGTTGHAGGGLGLGLYIAQQIVLAHGGELKVEAGDGQVTFCAELPLAP